jgi:hypothetical protein
MSYPHSLTRVDELVTLPPGRVSLAKTIGSALFASESGSTNSSILDEDFIGESVRNLFIVKGYDMLLAMEKFGLTVED